MTILTALLVSACDTTPVRDDRGQGRELPEDQVSTVEVIPLEDSALGSGFDTPAQQTDPGQAIEADLREAVNSLPPYRQSAYLDAVDKLIGSGRLKAAGELLNQVDVTGMAPVLRVRKQLLQAEIDFQRDELDRALRFVNRSLDTGNVDPTYISRSLDLKARIELLQKRPLEAAKAWIRRDNYLAESGTIADNNARIWYALGHLNELDLQLAGQAGAEPTLRGWLDLAILFLEFGGDRQALRTTVTRWSNANRAHPAAEFATALLGPQRAPGIRQVALLLPLSSNYGSAARTVYNGFEAAHRGDSDPARPQLIFYDVGGEPALAANYTGVAASEGADVIVGPLGKAAVTALLDARLPPKPMVLLGSVSADRSVPADTYQFDLSPEPEAQQVAEFMYVSGHRRVAALYPDDEWGQRVYDAFVEHWRKLGGTLAEGRAFERSADDHTSAIKNLFNLTESETRQALLEAGTGLNLDFDPRRRQDIDALFMAARPDEARLLKPQIDFFQGLDLPVYSTSHVYSGAPNAVKDTDLDGVMFPDMPWVLRNTARINSLRSKLIEAGFSDAREELFAFGYDAYQLALLATNPQTARAEPVQGLTGELIVADNGRVHRRLAWAEFKNGVPAKIWRR